MALTIGPTPEPQEQPSSKKTKKSNPQKCIFEDEITLKEIDNGDNVLTKNEVATFFGTKFMQNYPATLSMLAMAKNVQECVNNIMTANIEIGDKLKNSKALKILENIDNAIHKIINNDIVNKDYNEENRRVR